MRLPLLRQRTIYLPTLLGSVILAAAAGFLVLILIISAHSFLAVNSPPTGKADLLVLEGWAPDPVVQEAANLFHNGSYPRFAVTGGEVVGVSHLIPFGSFAEFGAMRLEKIGVTRQSLIVPEPTSSKRRRTLHDALALKKKIDSGNLRISSLTLVTSDVHARRSRMAYRRAFGHGIEVFVVPVSPGDFDSDDWWQSSHGFKTIVMELMSFCYEWLVPAPLPE
jgi:uncharacterized SAM-binding protein YcdF (DUF218 family)